MAMHNASSLNSLKEVAKPYNVVRSAVVAWYYTIYESASAMNLAWSGNNSETHAKTAKIWHNNIIDGNKCIGPFALHLNTLVKEKVKERVDSLKNGASFKLYHLPETNRDAWGCLLYTSPSPRDLSTSRMPSSA